MSANDTRGSRPKQILKEITMQMYKKDEFRPTSLNLAANRKARSDKRSCGRHVQIAAETWSVFGSVSFVASHSSRPCPGAGVDKIKGRRDIVVFSFICRIRVLDRCKRDDGFILSSGV